VATLGDAAAAVRRRMALQEGSPCEEPDFVRLSERAVKPARAGPRSPGFGMNDEAICHVLLFRRLLARKQLNWSPRFSSVAYAKVPLIGRVLCALSSIAAGGRRLLLLLSSLLQ
jgi:hypothetical protein